MREVRRSVWNSMNEVEKYLKNTNANDELMNSFELVKKTLQNPYNSSDSSNNNNNNNNNLNNDDNEKNLNNDRKILINNLFPSLSQSSVELKKNFRNNNVNNFNEENYKGWTIGSSRRRKKMEESEVEKNLNELGKNWHLDLLGLSNSSLFLREGPIVVVGKTLLFEVGKKIHEKFNQLLLPVLKDLQDLYLPNPYHNSLHGATVGHMSYLLSKLVLKDRKFNELEEFIFILSSLGHDVGHPGKTNSFLTNTKNPLSLIYNDNSILENYHCSLLFHILRHNSEFYNLISDINWESLRKRIIQLILSTDMKNHFLHINNVKIRRENNEFNIKKNEDDFWLLLVLCIKSADIGHNFLPWLDHLPWTNVLFQEFYLQGDEEKKLSIPLLLIFDRTKSNDIPESQLTFFSSFTQPLLIELSFFDNNNFIKNVLLVNSNNNLNNWMKWKGYNIQYILNYLDNNNNNNNNDNNNNIKDEFI